MTTKFIFQFPGATLETLTNGYNIKNIGGGGNSNKTPSLIEVRDPTKCSIDAYSLRTFNQENPPNYDGLVSPSGSYGCNAGVGGLTLPIYDFGRSFSNSVDIYSSYCKNNNVFCNSFFIESYIAIPKNDGTKNHCSISVNMKPGKTCDDLNFGNDAYYFKDASGKKIDSAFYDGTVKVQCPGGSLINYPTENSNVSVAIKDGVPQLEFTRTGTGSLDCQHNADSENYMGFICNDTGGVDAVQYKCGL